MQNVSNGILFLSFGSVADNTLMLNDRTRTKFSITNNNLNIEWRSIYSMSKLERRCNMYFASFDGTAYEVLGKDNDDLNKELNPDTETSKNVLGETTFKHNGYEPEISLDPYYADPTSTLYEKLLAAAVQEKYSDADIKGYFVEAVFDKAENGGVLTGTGYKREAYIVPQSTGGDTSGFSIPFTVNPVGPMTEVNVNYTIADRTVTVTNKTA